MGKSENNEKLHIDIGKKGLSNFDFENKGLSKSDFENKGLRQDRVSKSAKSKRRSIVAAPLKKTLYSYSTNLAKILCMG